ncbi:DUF1491 family protein [Manganibacter manganicus]|uniref:DUF1491 domain-containing protein n=1 Tax=Manganibacter manganicus TaxID=1873176 RepID=A0A1V8RPZ7_9HYPH|nr:DUF1491 family protein [Pseudaminobacter manganicus]OQM75203.1 hypothetical protein BFN67_19545 [Pseudaminobacter manganicus]
MRVTSDLWVSALIRRVFSAGGFAAIMRRGAAEAGAIFILSRTRLGEVMLFGPAPQVDYDTARPDERFFTPLSADEDMAAIEARLAKETRFDPDIWVVEIEIGVIPVEDLIVVRSGPL